MRHAKLGKRYRPAAALLPSLLTTAALLCASDVGCAQSSVDFTGPLAIHAMTNLGAHGSGYFQDPYPVRLPPPVDKRAVIFSGTTQAVMGCNYPLSTGCFSWTPAQIDAGKLGTAITAAHAEFTNFQNLNVFQDDGGGWHAVLAIGVKKCGDPSSNHWTVLVHAHPGADASPDKIPLSWSADTVLSGSFATDVQGNYDGKYFEDKGKLYLLYVKNFTPEPALRNGIVIQPMQSPMQPAPVGLTTLLTTGDRFGPLASEKYDGTQAKLVEAPYIARLGGKYALIYSTGAYQHNDYKVGVAWSDTLMPVPGGRYRKVLQTDVQGVWSRPGAAEVHYLLQSQQPNWPNFTPNQVFGPGVASALEAPNGNWTLFFAGYDFADRPSGPTGIAVAQHRRPYFVRLRASIPINEPVADATDAELAAWLEPEER